MPPPTSKIHNTHTDHAFSLTISPSFDLIHKRLAHPGKDTLQQMIKGRLVHGLEDIPSELGDFDCIACIQGKMICGPFLDSHERAGEHLGCLHSDVCSPMEVQSLGKKCFFCTLVDDNTGCYQYCYYSKSPEDYIHVRLSSLFTPQPCKAFPCRVLVLAGLSRCL